MVYVALNIIISLSFFFCTFYIDRKLQKITPESGNLIIPLLIASVESLVFSFALAFSKVWSVSFVKNILLIVNWLDVVFWTLLSFAFINLGVQRKRKIITVLTFAFIIAGCIFVKVKLNETTITSDKFYTIYTDYVFSHPARDFFPWTWSSLYQIIYQMLLPSICYIFLILLQEKNGSSLQRYQGLVVGESLLLLWALTFFKNIMTNSLPGFTCLFMFPVIFMIVLIIFGLKKKTIPSGANIITNFIKAVLSYILPAVAVGFLIMSSQPSGKFMYTPSFILIFVLVAVVAFIISYKISNLLSKSARLYTSEYGPSLEKDLATIDYSDEMDTITEKMYQIFRRNVQASSMTVYISNQKGGLEVAYSSNKTSKVIQTSNPIFDTLLNINQSVVCYYQVGKIHDLSPIENQLDKFFTETKTDALFILNEGRNILGLITLGKKVSGDHYKEYDIETFNKLYSYFFVFGYYMRNISNKEILSVVNREIKMSSQIITSIQENIDHINNSKVDIGYLMVPAHNIGGEFIDLIRLTATRHLFVVGDLSGKGIAASMNMVILKSIIRTFLAETHDFKELVVKINEFIRTSLPKGTIFAGLLALVDFETDTMYYINCGIPALMMYTQVYNNVIEIQGSGHILGFVKDISPFISVKTTKLSRGDIILACTDGLVKSHSLRGEQFGKERIQQALLDNSTYPAQRMAQFTFDGLMKFMSKEMEDDISILVMKYESSIEYADEMESLDDEEIAALDEAAEAQVEEAPVEAVETPAEEAPEAVESAPEAPVEDFSTEAPVEPAADFEAPVEPMPDFEAPVTDAVEEPVADFEAPSEPIAEPAAEQSMDLADDIPEGFQGLLDDTDEAPAFEEPKVEELENLSDFEAVGDEEIDLSQMPPVKDDIPAVEEIADAEEEKPSVPNEFDAADFGNFDDMFKN